jgi:hypothetical protein
MKSDSPKSDSPKREAFEQHQRPTPLEDLLGRQVVARFCPKSIGRTDRPAPRFSARARSHARKCFSDVSRNDRNLPRSGRAAARSFFSESRCEEGLREVLSFVRLMPPPAHKRVKRIPIILAKSG